jgi:protein-S-isoprenylcysteine O-methyltransferase Ste14
LRSKGFRIGVGAFLVFLLGAYAFYFIRNVGGVSFADGVLTVKGARYVIGFLLLASLPPAILLWVAIHPFAAFWRRMGPALTYGILGVPVIGYMVFTWACRRFLLGRDLGTSAVAIVAAVALFAAGIAISRVRRQQLNLAKLSGFPELSEKLYPGKLLEEGVYARVRHPRYVEVTMVSLSYALFANYSGVYVILGLCLLMLLFVVELEERELHRRFGAAYEEYCRRVPRFVPRRKRNAAKGEQP